MTVLSGMPLVCLAYVQDHIPISLSDLSSQVSVQIRILKQVQDAERKRQADMKTLTELVQKRMPNSQTVASETETTTEDDIVGGSIEHITESITHFATTTNALGLIDTELDGSMTPTRTTPTSHVLPVLQNIHETQNSLDAAQDLSDLRQLMRVALQTGSDAEMVEVLQIGRQEMPDAIKTLQRALERLAERGELPSDAAEAKRVILGTVVRKVSVKDVDGKEGGLKRSKTIVSVDSSSSSGESGSANSAEARRKDTLEWEFIESGIDCLRRMSRGVETSLPSWTITK